MSEQPSEPTGLVLEIQKMSTEDGPGLRTTLFLKGCSLSCTWCHNPESISQKPQLRWIDNRCVGCLECLKSCPEGALWAGEAGISIDRSLCTGCGGCAEECPSGALELWGRVMNCSEAFDELMKDRAYFGDEGGITISGGEAVLQAEFVHCLFSRFRAEGIHTALDTCGVCPTEKLRLAGQEADLFLFDIKEIDPSLHTEYTGGPLERVEENYRLLVELVRNSRLHNQVWSGHREKRLWVRTPVIPGMTDRRENIAGIARLILEQGEDGVERWELCAFNNLCRDKYRHLGSAWALEELPLMKEEEMKELRRTAIEAGFPEEKLFWTGMVRKGEE